MKKRLAEIKVTSHVGRDLLASATSFKTEAAAVWEYVVNSLQFVDRNVAPRVVVDVLPQQRIIRISDNGRGMDEPDLEHFFKMHAENLDRLRGRPGRGKFGTGKSAAFGIARCLRVDTVRKGLRNVIILTREKIENSNGEDIPLVWEIRNERVGTPNGTMISIEDIALERIRTQPIVEYIERHLQVFRALMPEVAVNNHVCCYREPEIDTIHSFRPTESQARVIGDVELLIKVARAPLREADQGITITAGGGNLLSVERAGVENKEFGTYLFGEIDVPELERSDSPLQPFDPTRSLQLNPQHPVAAVLLGFIGSKLELVRSDLVRRAKEARKTEEARRLDAEANRIAEVLNEDFTSLLDRLTDIRATAIAPGAAAQRSGRAQVGGGSEESWIEGGTEPGRFDNRNKLKVVGNSGGRSDPRLVRPATRDDKGNRTVDRAGSGSSKQSMPRGGFRVKHQHLGSTEDRSRYDPAILTILINLDHPVVKAALETSGPEDVAFRRLCFEIAFSEYAMALGHHVLQQDPSIPGDDLLYEVRSSLNRVARSAASLYR